MSPPLAGQVALVTGAGRGIGKAIALRLATDGADVAILDVDGQTAETTAEEIRRLARKSIGAQTDVSDYAAVERGIATAVDGLGRLDILVNNAGVETRAPLLEIDPADWRKQIDVNLTGTFYCTQIGAREMVKRRLWTHHQPIVGGRSDRAH